MRTVGNYEVLAPLHREPVGTMHLGRHRYLGRDVRVLLVDAQLAGHAGFRRRFLREMHSAGRLAHQNIVRVLDVGEEGEAIYVVLESEPGEDSSRVLREGGRMTPERAFGLGARIAGALIHAHLKGILHRDLHPANVWIRSDGSPIIRGFGFALPADARELPPDAILPVDPGTLLYRAPEALEGGVVDARSDEWSLGALLFYFLCGRPPFAAPDPIARRAAIAEGRLDLPPAIAAALTPPAVELLASLMASDPARRPGSLYEVKAAFEEYSMRTAATQLGSETPNRLEPGASFESSKTLASYQILDRLGQGGFGTVYKVREAGSNRLLALKVLRSDAIDDPLLLARFEREWHAVSSLDHPNIIRTVEVGNEQGRLYFVMEFVDGLDLRSLVQSTGRLGTEQAIRIARGVASALEAAHAAGIIHRDITPSNVLLDPTGRVVLTDFGLAHVPGDERLTMTGDMIGTPRYMAPEIVGGRTYDQRTDLYALGVILYEMIAGKPPFVDDQLWPLFRRIVQEEPPHAEDFPENVSPSLRAVVLRLLEKVPEARYRSATEVLREFDRIESELE